MTRTTLPVTEILVEDRQRVLREDNVTAIADSMKSLGLIQPIVINQHKRLIAGGHRLAAAKKLGWTFIDVVYRETLTEDELQELELTENLKRADNTWQETCLAVAKIHYLKVRRSALESKSWGQRDTGNLLNVNQANITYSLIVAKELINDPTKSNEFWKASNFSEAYSIIVKRNEDAALARLAQSQYTSVFEESSPDMFVIPEETIDLTEEVTPADRELDEQLRTIRDKENIVDYINVVNENPLYKNRVAAHWLYANKHLTRSDFDTAWANRKDDSLFWEYKEIYSEIKIPISQRYIKGDSITFMHANPGRFDHVITDIPFGIDIDYIDQSNSIKNINDIKAEHTVEGNLELHAQFFKAAYATLKESGFCITWLDIMQWQRMYDLAVDAGFKVTRWPFVWVKTYPCLNQMAQYNFTKSVEYAMVCRKGNITLPEKQSTCHIAAGKDDFSEGHPFAKPFTVWERLINAVSIRNQSILDPFAGSGSCLKSGIKLERIMTGVEKDELLFNSGLESMKQFYLTLNPKITFA